jgi:hypothetical protein
MLAEMREHPGGSALNIATSAAVQPGSLRCSAFIECVPREHGWHVQRLCDGRGERGRCRVSNSTPFEDSGTCHPTDWKSVVPIAGLMESYLT